MKKLLFLLPFTLFVACDNVGKYAEAITSVAGEWDGATEAVTGLLGNITTAQGGITEMLGGMNISEELQGSLAADVLGQLTGFKDQVTNQGTALSGILEQVNAFKGQWEEKGQALQGLKDGLSAGKLPEDVEGTISGLKEMIATGTSKVGEWGPQVEGAQSGAKSAFDQFTSLLASVTAGE
ncbi:MAG: hypothetical protein KTR30_37310 [Saprospiraceae bacterium]|nr:hypothetical protein [Saprospiraceae bacterium]